LIKKDGIEGSFEVGVYFYLCAIRTHELAKKLLRLEKCSKELACSARDWDGKDYLRLIPRVVW
jgi:hypothetical protein